MSGQSEVDDRVRPPPKKSKKGADKVQKSRLCLICNVFYKNGNSYWQHVRYVHPIMLSECVICDKSYKRITMAKRHVLRSHKIAWHLCSNYVRRITNNDVNFKKVRKSSKGNNLNYFKKKTLHLISCFNCYNCSGSFKTLTELFQHVRTHRYNSRNDDISSDSEKADSSCGEIDSNHENPDSRSEEVDSVKDVERPYYS